MPTVRNAFEGLATAVKQDGIITALSSTLSTAVSNWPSAFPLPTSQVDELKPAEPPESYPLPNDQAESLAPPSDFPDAGGHTRLELVRDRVGDVVTRLGQAISIQGTVDVGNHPSEYPLPENQRASLEPKDAVGVTNFPTTYPDQHEQPLTDAQLRAEPVPTYEGPLIVSDEDSSLDRTLAGGETFVGPWVDALDAVDLRANLISHQQAVEVELQWGSVEDGVVRSTFAEVPAGIGVAYSFPITARFYRVRVTNLHNSQSTDVLSRMGQSRRASSLAQMPVATPINDGSLAGLTRSVITGKDHQGNYQNVRVNPQGRLSASVEAHDLDASTTTAFTGGHVDGGEVKANQGSAGRVHVADQHAQALTNSQLRASPVPVEMAIRSTQGSTSQHTVGSTPVEVVAANPDRRAVVVSVADGEVYLGFDDQDQHLRVVTNGSFSTEDYTGSVWAVSTSGDADVRVGELLT